MNAPIERRVLAPSGAAGMTEQYGATPKEWDHWSTVLGLTTDLLPVVSNPSAKISPASKMKGIGKTPSVYNQGGLVAGIPNWTSKLATPEEVGLWSTEPDYGICLQTRAVRAIDVDIEDPGESRMVRAALLSFLGPVPVRVRSNSSKFLILVNTPGDMSKRVIKTAHGIIELLATGQQCVIAGTHPSGARYEWEGGLPSGIAHLPLEKIEVLW